MKVQLFTPELIEHTDGRSFPAEMVRPNDATEDEYLFVEYEAYADLEKRVKELETELQLLKLSVTRMEIGV